MFKLKKALICLVLSVILVTTGIFPVMAKAAEDLSSKNPVNTGDHKACILSWSSDESGQVLEKVTIGEENFVYTYNDNKNRISKSSKEGTVAFSYNDESRLISEVRADSEFEYQYDFMNSLIGFTLEGTVYKYVKDDDFNVTAITDADNNYLAKYEYDKNGIVSAILGKDDTGKWVDMSKDSSFIGTLNMIRLHSYYFDVETGWYYNGCQYYDSTINKYIANADNHNTVTIPGRFKKNHIINTIDPDLTPTEQRIVNWYGTLINDSNFGLPISYTTGWYNSLSDVEILSRLLYGENTLNQYDQSAVARVLTNRKINGNFGGTTYRGVATKAGQFEPITGGSTGTANARTPDKSNPRWDDAVLSACTLLTASPGSDYDFFIYKPTGISTQLYFVGLNYFLSVGRDAVPAGTGLTYSFGGSYVKIKDVVIVFDTTNTFQNPGSKSSITGNSQLDTYSERASHNIFFNY